MATSPTYPTATGPVAVVKTLVNADSTNYVDVYDNSAGAASIRVEALSLCSDDTSTVNIAFALYSGSTVYLLGTVRAATLSGTDGATARVNALATIGTISPDGVLVLEVPAGTKLQAKSLVAVTAAKTVTLAGWARNYA